jgi:hypothetical protein
LFLANEGELFSKDEERKETGVLTIQTNTSSADLLVEFYTKMQTDWAILVGYNKIRFKSSLSFEELVGMAQLINRDVITAGTSKLGLFQRVSNDFGACHTFSIHEAELNPGFDQKDSTNLHTVQVNHIPSTFPVSHFQHVVHSIAGEKVIGEPKVIPAEGSLSLNFVINADHKYIQCIQKDPVLAYGQWTFSVEVAPHDHRAREEESVDHPRLR